MRQNTSLACAPLLAFLLSTAYAASWPTVPEPDDAKSQWVAKDMLYNGLPMRTSRFTSALSVQQLLAFYQRQWPGQTVVNQVAAKTVVGHAQSHHYVTVEISGNGAGSQGQIGIIELIRNKPGKSPGADFPKPSGTQVINDIQYLDDSARTLSMQSKLSPFQSESFYRARLPAAGWQPEMSATPCSVIANVCIGRYRKGKQIMTMTFNRQGKSTSIVVNQVQK